MNQLTFNKVYQSLNPAQKKAVDAIEGPVMVVAGPGTGKTQVLAARIANILLKTDTDPTSILALTFTESAAKNMRERLVQMIGKTGYYVNISTFHSFCGDIIRSYPEFFSINRDSEPLSDLERYEIFKNILNDLTLKSIKPLNSPYHYLKSIIKAISDLKREGVTVEHYKKILLSAKNELAKNQELSKTKLALLKKNLEKNLEVWQVYSEYEKRLKKNLRYDFDDMIALVVEAFEKEELLLREHQENLHYFLVDEFQDTNSAQNKVVDLLASYWQDQANIFVVGDPNQSIFRFQGASVENINNFQRTYPSAEVIFLDVGYRCNQNVYDAASNLIKENKLLLKDSFNLKQKSTAKQNLPLSIYESPSDVMETVYIAERVNELIKSGVNPTQIAILYRVNSDEALLAETLAKWSIKFEIQSGSDVLKDEVMNQLLNLFKVIADLRKASEDETLFLVLLYEWLGVDALSVMKMSRLAGKHQISLVEAIEKNWTELSSAESQKLRDILSKFYEWGKLDAQLSFNKWFERVINESNFLSWILKQESKIELLNNLNSLFNQVKILLNNNHELKLDDFLRVLTVIKENKLKIKVDDLNIKRDAVTLSTVHSAKGLEWQYVFLYNCIDGKWGNNRSRDLIKLPAEILTTDISKKEKNEDERRLFYVGLTRSSKQTIISYPKTINLNSRSKDVISSLFIEEIGSICQKENKENLDQKAEEFLVKLMQTPVKREVSVTEKEFFQSLVSEFKLSVTALNNYLRDPKEFVQNNLLRVPRAKEDFMSFGTAVHSALEKQFNHLQQTGKKLSLADFLIKFEQALKKEVMDKKEFEKRLNYGREILEKYYLNYQTEKIEPLFIERMFGTGSRKTVLDDIYLTGRIDRVDWLNKAKKEVTVIDYKTGQAKSINAIEGKLKSQQLSERELTLPESIRGPYKRQLLFYKLLGQLDRSFPYTVTEGIFDFIEPNKQTGKFVRRKIALLDNEVEDLKNLIRQVMKEIRSLEFLAEI